MLHDFCCIFNKMYESKKTLKECLWVLVSSILSDSSITMKLLDFIIDTYKVDSIKNMARQKQGISSTKFSITGFEQKVTSHKVATVESS